MLQEPRYWVLLPYPHGMPGHLFTLLDTLQWRHSVVKRDLTRFRDIKSAATARNDETNGFCSTTRGEHSMMTKKAAQDEYSCPLGCPGTKLVGITASGYGADAYNIYSRLRDGLLLDLPIQAFPTVLGARDTQPLWEGKHGWTYTFGACESNFLDCFFLPHSPCPPVAMDVRALNNTELEMFSFNSDRLSFGDGGRKRGFELKGWDDLVGTGRNPAIPRRSIQDLWPSSLPARQVLYSYFFRPKYVLRRAVHERLLQFDARLKKSQSTPSPRQPCATFHVRRGDILFHPDQNQARFYLPLTAYLHVARTHMNVLNIRNIILFTDSSTVIQEAKQCVLEYPELCKGITFQYLQKDRWVGGEGGWENPFPSGNSTEELVDLHQEVTLAQRCDLAVTGESEFGEVLYQHMCCGFPTRERGTMPQRCLCPPRIKLLQSGFSCQNGNVLLCGTDAELESLLMRDPEHKGATFSASSEAFKQSTTVQIQPNIGGESKSFLLEKIDDPAVSELLLKAAEKSKGVMCASYDAGPDRSAVCHAHSAI